jgi:hypothetical protein
MKKMQDDAILTHSRTFLTISSQPEPLNNNKNDTIPTTKINLIWL